MGIVVDTVRGELRLPSYKIDETQAKLRWWLRRRSGPFKEYESLVGHLSHAATVIHQGRTFLRHLYVIMKSASSRRHYVHLDGEARADLSWWHCLLSHWNGFMFFRHTTAPAAHVYSDASGSFGCGGVILPSHWFQLQWPTAWSAMDITIKEMVPIVIAAALWGGYWHRMHICFHSDNLAVVAILQKQSTKDPITHHLVRCFYFYSAFFQFQYSVGHT